MTRSKDTFGGQKLVRLERRERVKALRSEKNKEKRLRAEERSRIRQEQGPEACPVQQPKTIENMRILDATTVQPDDAEEMLVENTDEFADYFNLASQPRLLLTTSPKAKGAAFKLCYELRRCIPGVTFVKRQSIPLKKLVEAAKLKDFTDLMVVHEDNNKPNGLILCHLPDGPTAYFKLQNVKLMSEIKNCERCKKLHGNPELLLNNFTTRLGHSVARMFACLFPQSPHFRGRRVVTLHNQRDYIFFRQHWYEFKADGTRAALKELGPRFTLRLKAFQTGTFDPQFGQFEWVLKRHEMEKSRRKFYL